MGTGYRKLMVGLGLLIAVICAAVAGGAAAGAPGITTIIVGNTTLDVGQSGSVGVWALNVPVGSGVGAYDIRIDYDNTVVDVTGCGDGDACWYSPGFGCNPDAGGGTYMLVNSISQQCMTGCEGDTKLFEIIFDCIGEGPNIWHITVTDFGDCDADYIDYVTVDGWLNWDGAGELTPTAKPTQTPTSKPTPTPTPTPEPAEGDTYMWVVLGIIIGVVAVGGVALLMLRSRV